VRAGWSALRPPPGSTLAQDKEFRSMVLASAEEVETYLFCQLDLVQHTGHPISSRSRFSSPEVGKEGVEAMDAGFHDSS
jgi:hypothetical protein